MKIAILGAGAMGGLFGGLLARAGEDVVLLDVNRAHVDAINRDGLRLDRDAGTVVVPVPARLPEAGGDPVDLIILFTKIMHSAAALAAAGHLIGPETAVLTVQNGLGNVARIETAVPRTRIIVGMTTFPADLAGPGHVRSHGDGTIRINGADGTPRDRDREIARRFSAAGLDCTVDESVEAAIWSKVAFNAAMNAICAVARTTPGGIGDCADGIALARDTAAEACEVARASGVAADTDAVFATIDMAVREHRDHQPSMLQDILAGRPTEIDALNGAIASAARRAGTTAPINETLARLVRLIESQSVAS